MGEKMANINIVDKQIVNEWPCKKLKEEIETYRMTIELPKSSIDEALKALKNFKTSVKQRFKKIDRARTFAHKEFKKRGLKSYNNYHNAVSVDLRNVRFANKIGKYLKKNRIFINIKVLSPPTLVLTSYAPVSDITKKAKEENIIADVFGPLAFDNSVSKKSAVIKKIKNEVAGNTDILLVPNVEAGNALVKMMIYFMGACAAGVIIGGKVPVVITSRSDEAEARFASIAAAIVALN